MFMLAFNFGVPFFSCDLCVFFCFCCFSAIARGMRSGYAEDARGIHDTQGSRD